ncbi:MAG: hypothetical protein LBG61_04220 [Burkholderiales bacterium]|jgi:hypothetical protein|nr:hypothetical protein [Burkholderiales bacterium]
MMMLNKYIFILTFGLVPFVVTSCGGSGGGSGGDDNNNDNNKNSQEITCVGENCARSKAITINDRTPSASFVDLDLRIPFDDRFLTVEGIWGFQRYRDIQPDLYHSDSVYRKALAAGETQFYCTSFVFMLPLCSATPELLENTGIDNAVVFFSGTFNPAAIKGFNLQIHTKNPSLITDDQFITLFGAMNEPPISSETGAIYTHWNDDFVYTSYQNAQSLFNECTPFSYGDLSYTCQDAEEAVYCDVQKNKSALQRTFGIIIAGEELHVSRVLRWVREEDVPEGFICAE